jgi:hypothetical protein
VIPAVVLLLDLLSAFAVWKERRAEKASDMTTQQSSNPTIFG